MILMLGLASAQSWTDLGWGVEYAQWTTGDPNRITALRVNLCHPGLSVRATTSDERGQRTSSWASPLGLTAAVNGGFFASGYKPDQGVAAGNGVEWPDSADSGVRGWWAFGEHQQKHSSAGAVEGLPSWAEQAINGDATLVSNGGALNCGGCGGGRNPRTAIGTSQDHNTLYLVTVDGRSSSSVGMTIDELAVLMDSLGAWQAMNLDGGGSSTLWTSTHGVANKPSDGSERVVGNHLGFLTPGIGLTRYCSTGWRADYLGIDFPRAEGSTITAPAGSLVRGTMSLKNTGTTTWDSTNTRLAPLPRDVASPLQGDDWIAGNRVVAVQASTAPGATGTFSFSLRVPDQVGSSTRFDFSVLQESVAWFGSSWGPEDGTFYLTVVASEPEPEDTEEPVDTSVQDSPAQDSPTQDSAAVEGDLPWGRERLPTGCTSAPSATLLSALLGLFLVRR